MSDLGSVISGMLNGLAFARYQSDLTTKQLAEQYQRDKLLSLFPVPRMDFQSVEADISLVLNEVVRNDIPSPIPPSAPIPPSTPTIPYPPGKLPPTGETPPTIPPRPDLPMESISINLQSGDDINQLAQSLLKIVTDQLNLPTSLRSNTGKALPNLHNRFVEELSRFKAESVKAAAIIGQPPIVMMPSSDLRVGVTPTEIEKATPAALGRIKLQMGVQNYEWVEVDRDAAGGSIQKLTPTGR